jgi:hypothetical protein
MSNCGYCGEKNYLSNRFLRQTAQVNLMPRSARRYEIFLPLSFNDGRAIRDELFESVESRLIDRFAGVTAHRRDFPLRGAWQSESRVYLDQIIILTVLDFRRLGSTRFIAELKRDLLRDFEQLEILITESSLRVH